MTDPQTTPQTAPKIAKPKAPPRSGPKPVVEMSDEDVSRLHLKSGCHPDTIRRWARGMRVKPVSNRRIREACARLGITVKPEKS